MRSHVLHARKFNLTASALGLAKNDRKLRRIALLVMDRTLAVWPAGSAAHSRASDRCPLRTRAPQSWLPPRRLCLPGKSISGWTTRMWRVRASLRENVFSSTHKAQRTFCLRALWIVSSCRVRS